MIQCFQRHRHVFFLPVPYLQSRLLDYTGKRKRQCPRVCLYLNLTFIAFKRAEASSLFFATRYQNKSITAVSVFLALIFITTYYIELVNCIFKGLTCDLILCLKKNREQDRPSFHHDFRFLGEVFAFTDFLFDVFFFPFDDFVNFIRLAFDFFSLSIFFLNSSTWTLASSLAIPKFS